MADRCTSSFRSFRLHTIFTILLPALCILAFVSPAFASNASPTHLRVTVLPYFSFAPFYIAEAEGYFADENLDVEFVRFQRNADSLTSLLRGDLEVDTIFTAGLLNAIARGENIRVVAARGTLTPNDCPVDGFLVRPDRKAEIAAMPAEALRKLTFGVDRTWQDSYYLHQWLQKHGLSLDDVKTELVPVPPARAEAVRQGALDVAFLSEPWITRARESGAAELLLPAADICPGYPFSVVIFGSAMLSRGDDVPVRFLRAYLRAVGRYGEGKTGRNIEILSAATKLEPELLRRICWPVIPGDGRIDPQGLADYSAWAAKQGLADRPLSAGEIWDPRFLDEAAGQ